MERMFLLGLVLTIVIATVVGRGYPHRPSGKSVCSLPMDPGRCKGSCPRYYYDTRTGKCRKFIYGCCGGNANNFRNERFCNWVCRNK
ncbi:PI-stichotoxin-She2a-like [Saccostrea echinata]|uniref:PI-stichotoxin-She2a-like n=1 Tax=Saccostrea echinata TaxID=191078 RepID=UPI002A7FEB38|nr:PI-stichotoxin-She2a-like [Saccostrea echinata]